MIWTSCVIGENTNTVPSLAKLRPMITPFTSFVPDINIGNAKTAPSIEGKVYDLIVFAEHVRSSCCHTILSKLELYQSPI